MPTVDCDCDGANEGAINEGAHSLFGPLDHLAVSMWLCPLWLSAAAPSLFGLSAWHRLSDDDAL